MAVSSHLLRNFIFELRKQFGTIVDIVWFTSTNLNLETGIATQQQESKRVKAIFIPKSLELDFLTKVRAKPFEYGGFFEKNIAIFIFDKNDPVDIGRFLITRDERYEIKEIRDLDFIKLIAAEQNTNIDLKNHIKLSLFSDLFLEQDTNV